MWIDGTGRPMPIRMPGCAEATAGKALNTNPPNHAYRITKLLLAAAVTPKSDLKAAAAHLVSLANARDGSDNVSVQIIRIRSVESVGMYRGRLYKLPQAPVR